MKINTLNNILFINNVSFLQKIISLKKCNIFITDLIEKSLEVIKKENIKFLVINVDFFTTTLLNLLEYLNKHFSNDLMSILVLGKDCNDEYIDEIYSYNGSFINTNNLSEKALIHTLNYWIETHLIKSEFIKDHHLLKEYKNVVDESNIVSKTDTKGFITYVNDQFCDISGYRKDELIGKPHNIIRHEEMPSDAFEKMWKTIKSKNTWKGIVKNRTKNNGFYYVHTTIKPILDTSGNIIEYIGIRKDITEEQNNKEALQHELNLTTDNMQEMMKRSREYHKAMDQSTILTRVDLDGNITYVNHEFTLALGYSLDEVKGNDHSIMKHPDTPKIIIKNLWDTILLGNTWKGMIQNLNKCGKTVWLDTVIVPIKNMEDQIVEYLSIRHNVSEVVHLHEEIETTEGELIYTLGAAAETRSKETSHHVKRVAHYSKLLAQLYGLDTHESEIIFQASPMHDIGKIGIPDHILNKPGKLTSNEWDIMRTHSELGYKILASSTRPILKASATISHEHHEKWDGSGYPQELKGEEIHIYGRITAIADVFDALGSDRVYKKAWELNRIIELFKNQRGKHFDPKLIDLFLNNIEEFVKISYQFRDTIEV